MANCGVKFRAYPTVEQAHTLSQWIGCARVIYQKRKRKAPTFKVGDISELKRPQHQTVQG